MARRRSEGGPAARRGRATPPACVPGGAPQALGFTNVAYARSVRFTFAGGNMIIQILGLLFIGLVIGALARLIKPGKQRLSMLLTLVLGVCGALIGGVLASLIGTGNIFELDFLGFVFA